MQENVHHEHTPADDIASARADEAFNNGKWEQFIGKELTKPSEPIDKPGYPDFYQPAEERQTLEDAQLQVSAREFGTLFDDLMLQNMDAVEHYEAIEGRPRADLLKHIEVDGQQYSLAVHDKGKREEGSSTSGVAFRASEIIEREISLQRMAANGYGRESWSYRQGADGVVRRWDGGDITAEQQKERELGIEDEEILHDGDESLEEIGRAALKNIQNLTEDGIPNRRLEEDMGLNNQPVDPEEIQGLSDFLKRATYVD